MKTGANTLLWAATAAVALIGATSVSAASILNGDFEQCAVGCPTNLTPLSGGSGELTDWTVSSGDQGNANAAVEWVTNGGAGWNSASGNYSIALSGKNEGTISQNIALQKGVTYNVTFQVSGNPRQYGATKNVGIDVGGVTKTFSFTDDSPSNSKLKWITESYTFTATSTGLTKLSLFNDHTGPLKGGQPKLYGMALDDVAIQTVAVPEPATWAMMILGAGLVGGGLRGRRRALANVAA